MNPERMLELCRKGQWNIDRDLDWSATPREMAPDEERAIVQYFTDMAGIERFAGALFEEQRRRTEDPTLKKIFATFVADEERHAKVAERLAAFYDVRKLQRYEMSPSLLAFQPHFLNALRYLSAEIANAYITGGELILDVALLRSINDFVHDTMSQRAMDLVNKDESRHIAVDYHMAEYYASPEYQRWLESQPPRPFGETLAAWWTFANLLYHAKPFFEDVFLAPMSVVDPSGRRIREALKRFQLLAEKPEIAKRLPALHAEGSRRRDASGPRPRLRRRPRARRRSSPRAAPGHVHGRGGEARPPDELRRARGGSGRRESLLLTSGETGRA